MEALESRRLMHAGHEHGTGLLGEYFNNADFTDPKLTRVDPVVDFYWDSGSPAAALSSDTFSVRWTGQLQPAKSEAYTLVARTDDGVRMWLDGKLIVDKFADVSTITDHASAPVELVAGQRYDIKIEYFENVSRAGARLFWSSPTTPREIIPTANLFNGQGPTAPTVPAAPSELYARPASASRIDLTWTDGSDNETAFEIEHSGDGVTFTPLAIVGAGVTAYAHEGLAPGTRHLYRVRAANGAGTSSWSNAGDATTPAELRTTSAAGTTVLRIDAASGAGFTDASGKFWAKDAFFSGGVANGGMYAVANTTDDALYSTRRTGAFTYSSPVGNGDYTLRLLFSDWYASAGQRKFNVDVEGARVLTNFDIVAAAGTKTALVKTFNVRVADGRLNMAFSKVLNDATLSAFELVPAGAVTRPAAPTALDATGQTGGQVRVVWQDNSSNEASFEVERSTDGGATFARVGTTGVNQNSFVNSALDPARTYTYRARAVNSAGASAYSNTDSAKPLAASTFSRISWSTVASAPIARAEALGAVVGGKLYVFAGFSGNSGPVARSDVYDPATNSWKPIANMPRRLTHAGTTVVGSDVYFAGGYIGTGTGYTQQFGSKEVWRYNVGSNTYQAMPPLPTALASGGLVAVGRNLHCFGGNNSSRQDVGLHYVLNLDNTAAGWVTKRSMPTARSHMGYANFGGKVYAIGGQKGNDGSLVAQSVVEMYDPATGLWTTKKAMPRGVNHISGSTIVLGGRILTLGGQTAHNSSIAETYAFDPAANTWTTLSPLPAARFSGVAASINGAIFFTGGSSQTTTWKGIVS